MTPNPLVPGVMDLRGTYKGGGGPDKTVLNSAAQHDPARVHVLVTYLRQPDDAEFQIPAMAARLGINYVDVVDYPGIDYTCLRRLRHLLRKHNLTVVHAHDDKTLLYGWLLRLGDPRLKILYTCHSHAVHRRQEFAGTLAWLKFKLRQRIRIFLMQCYAKPILTVSADTRRRLIVNGLCPEAVAVLHNGIDIRRWAPGQGRPVLRQELALSDEVLLVGTVARITYEKDLPTFYAVARQVAAAHPAVRFVIVGDGYGDELARAREEVRRLGLAELIRFTGHRNDLQDIYASFDIFLMTSLTEGLPNTLLEAMAMGIPSVSTSVGGVPEVIEKGRSGLLVPAGDVEALSRALLSLMQDGGRRKALAQGSRRRIEENFDFARRVRRMEDYYSWFAGMADCPAVSAGPARECRS